MCPSSGNRQLHPRPVARLEQIDSWPPTSSARSRIPERPRPPSRPPLKPAPVVADPQHRAPDERELDLDACALGVLDDVRQALLGDAVDHELLLGRRAAAASPAS